MFKELFPHTFLNADTGQGGESTDPSNPPEDKTDPKDKTGGDPEPTPEAKFTQADLDRIVKERLDREKRKRDEALEAERKEAERKRLEEEEKYKELYEKQQEELTAQRAQALETRKESMLAKAGYSEEQASTLKKLLEGEKDEDLNASLESVKALFPPKQEKEYGDPSAGNGSKQPPKKKNLEDKGKSAYQRLKDIGKIKGRK